MKVVMCPKTQISILILGTLFVSHQVGAQYSKMNIMPRVIDFEGTMISTLEQYIHAENHRLEVLKKSIENRKARQNASMDVHEFSSNPLAIFSMIKYLTSDFKELQERMSNTDYDNIIPAMSQKSDMIVLTVDDYHSVVLNLINLQRVYGIAIPDLMNGRIFSQSSNTTLSVDDCIEIGSVAWEYNEHESVTAWLNRCLDLIPQENATLRKSLWDKLITSYLYLGEKMYAHTSATNSISAVWEDRSIHDLKQVLCEDLNKWGYWDTRTYESFRACRGDYVNETLSRNLKCRYNHSNTPFLLLAPLKEEEISIDPKIVLYREVLYDSEIEALQSEARSLLKTATVLKNNGADREADTAYRPSQTAFLDNRQNKYLNLWKRLQDLSGLSLDKSEMFQLLNYAPGGYYRVHADFLPQSTPDLKNKGQRVATALFYMNDVRLGGATVFPEIKLSVQPAKGSILFWINVKEDESEQTLTRHAACPVIYGEKWASTQWFRMNGQVLWKSLEARDNVYRWKPTKWPKSCDNFKVVPMPSFASEN